MSEEKREKALEKWRGNRVLHGPRDSAFRAGYDACAADNAERVKPPDYGIDHKLLCDWTNSLPEPFRAFVTSLETDADPSGNIRDAVCQRENAMALAERVKELEQHFEQLNNDRLAAESQLAEARATIERLEEELQEAHWNAMGEDL